ncbi:MAG: hypothetical protein LKI58_10370 [Actinomyces sp.]|nr:hypothetical protein [Actinomyces sp.]MCI1788447.1 hypothetical protein [Actinomyces sp.]MCI1831031.1 hypothetical protein [Actinomyces sp.]
MKITIQSFEGCPNRELLDQRLAETLRGRRDVTVIHQNIEGSSQLTVWVGLARRSLGRRRGLPMMEVPTPPIKKTSTCLTLPSLPRI